MVSISRCQRGSRSSSLLARIIIFLCLLPSQLNARDVIVDPVRKDDIGGSLGDIVSRIWIPPNTIINGKQLQYDYYYDSDKVTYAHEGTHAVNASIRNIYAVDNGYYLLEWNGICLDDIPNTTLSEIANLIPVDERGKIYKLYLIEQQRGWNNKPLYLLDELVSYTNGCIVGLEYNEYKRALDSYTRACEMYRYCKVLYKVCKEKQYKDIDEFLRLLEIIQRRLVLIEKSLRENLKTGD